MQRTIIKAGSPWWRIEFREIWEYRDLLRMMVKRDLTAVYKQTILGPLWFVIQPLVNTDGMPQFIFYMSGTVLWNYFSGCMTQAGNSLIGNTGVLKKVYFPRLIMPLSSVVTNLAHLTVNFLMFLGFYLYFLVAPNTAISPKISRSIFCVALFNAGVDVYDAGRVARISDS